MNKLTKTGIFLVSLALASCQVGAVAYAMPASEPQRSVEEANDITRSIVGFCRQAVRIKYSGGDWQNFVAVSTANLSYDSRLALMMGCDIYESGFTDGINNRS